MARTLSDFISWRRSNLARCPPITFLRASTDWQSFMKSVLHCTDLSDKTLKLICLVADALPWVGNVLLMSPEYFKSTTLISSDIEYVLKWKISWTEYLGCNPSQFPYCRMETSRKIDSRKLWMPSLQMMWATVWIAHWAYSISFVMVEFRYLQQVGLRSISTMMDKGKSIVFAEYYSQNSRSFSDWLYSILTWKCRCQSCDFEVVSAWSTDRKLAWIKAERNKAEHKLVLLQRHRAVASIWRWIRAHGKC